MNGELRQWDVVKVRIRPEDRDEHPAVVISCDELCGDAHRTALNVLYGTTRRPATSADSFEVTLNGADGLERPTLFHCGHLYTVDRRKVTTTLGRVSTERRRQIGRKIVACYRLPL
jgi:mRNA-degrading endonuclease toxin of MazEF toxin-antitoxin module